MHESRHRVFPGGVNGRRALVHGLLAASVVAVVSSLGGCTRSDPERELRDAVALMAKAVEKRAPGELLQFLAEDFTRESSAFGKRDVQRTLAGVLLRNEKIHVTAVITALAIGGDRARTKVRVVATGGSEGLLPERGQTWEFEIGWRRENDAWRAYNAEWHEGL
jgi:hypothetical protein